MEGKYPLESDGRPVNPYEIGLGLSYSANGEFNNHHEFFPARKFGQFLLYRTLRELNQSQIIVPTALHTEIHRKYNDVPFPTVQQALDQVVEAYEMGEPLQLGTSTVPIYAPISRNRMDKIMSEMRQDGSR